MGFQPWQRNSMRVFCLLFSLVLPLVTSKDYLLETHDDEKHVGSSEEVEVGQDYSHGCYKCRWRKSDDCHRPWVCKKCGKIDKEDEDYEKTRRRCKKYWAKEETGDLKDCKKRCKECKKCKKPD